MDDNHNEEIEVGNTSELLKEVFGDESDQGVLGGADVVGGEAMSGIGPSVVEHK